MSGGHDVRADVNTDAVDCCATPKHRVSAIGYRVSAIGYRKLIMDASPVTRNKSGQIVGRRQKKLVLNVVKKMVTEPLQDIENIPVDEAEESPDEDCLIGMREPLNRIAKRTSDFTGFSSKKVMAILREYRDTGTVVSPKRTRNKIKLSQRLDSFEKAAIRRKVHSFFLRKELPTLQKITDAINDDPDLRSIPRTSLYRVLKSLGFRFLRRNRNSALIDREEIVLWRRRYLRSIQQFRAEGRNILYLDETWVNVGYTTTKTWCDTTVKSKYDARRKGLTTGVQHPSGLGKRLIILHVGNENGFHPDGCLVFESNKSKDYHEDMDSNVFESWFTEIVKEVPQGTIFVIDNASYHSRVKNKAPTTRDRKDVILEWLRLHNVDVPVRSLKAELLELVKMNKPIRQYYVDDIAKQAQCIVLRLPPYHAELNPIELVWANLKARYKMKR